MKKFRQQHKFLFGSIIFSFAIAIVYSIFCIFISFDDSTTLSDVLGLAFIPLIPMILIILISFIGTKTFIKHPKATKIITGTLTTLIILYNY